MRLPIVLALSASLVISSPSALASASANIGLASNYLWRGITQTDDQAAISGGLDYEADSGFYVGTWTSNVDFTGGDTGYELDFYGGFAGTAGTIDYDLGAIYYAYPALDDLDFTEVYGSVGARGFTVGAALTVDSDGGGDDSHLYTHLGYEGKTGAGVGYGFTAGHYDFDDTALEDYNHYQLSLSKSDFTLAVDDNDLAGKTGDPRVSVAWSKSFDL